MDQTIRNQMKKMERRYVGGPSYPTVKDADIIAWDPKRYNGILFNENKNASMNVINFIDSQSTIVGSDRYEPIIQESGLLNTIRNWWNNSTLVSSSCIVTENLDCLATIQDIYGEQPIISASRTLNAMESDNLYKLMDLSEIEKENIRKTVYDQYDTYLKSVEISESAKQFMLSLEQDKVNILSECLTDKIKTFSFINRNLDQQVKELFDEYQLLQQEASRLIGMMRNCKKKVNMKYDKKSDNCKCITDEYIEDPSVNGCRLKTYDDLEIENERMMFYND
jgi:hypothetical protein